MWGNQNPIPHAVLVGKLVQLMGKAVLCSLNKLHMELR